MSDQGRYRKLFVRIWLHPGFAGLSDAEKVLALYVLTGPQSNRIGCFNFSIAQAAEHLETSTQPISKRLRTVCQTMGWLFDGRSRVMFIPSWFKFNPPDNVNVVRGILKDLNEIPPCGLRDAFAANVRTVPETLRQPFIEALNERFALGMPNQEQYQDQDQDPDQEQETRSAGKAGTERKALKPTNGSALKQPADSLIRMAQETLQLGISPTLPIDQKIDAFLNYHHSTLQGLASTPSRTAIAEAFNAARSIS